MLNVTGRSNSTTYRPVSAKSCIIGPSGTGMFGGADNLAGRVDDDVLNVVPGPVVGDGVQFAGAPVQLGVRGVAARQFPAEVARPDGLQLVGELVGQRARLHGGQHAPGVPDDVRVGGEVRVVVDRAARPFLAQRRRHRPGPDPPVAVPLGPAVAQPHAVHHAGAQEPVVLAPAGTRVLQAHRVRPVTQVAAVQLPRQGPGDGQVERGDLLLDRRERASQERGSARASRCPFRAAAAPAT